MIKLILPGKMDTNKAFSLFSYKNNIIP